MFPLSCGEYPPIFPQIVTECRSVSTGGTEIGVVAFYSANCADLAVTYTLFSSSCDTLESNSSGVFTVDPGVQYVVCAKVECFSPGGIREVCPIELLTLPVAFLGWKAEVVPAGVVLSWSTASERDSYAFEVERNGERLAAVPAAGNSWGLKSYRWTDLSPEDGKSVYRLVLVDIDGQREVLGELQVEWSAEKVDRMQGYDSAGRKIKP